MGSCSSSEAPVAAPPPTEPPVSNAQAIVEKNQGCMILLGGSDHEGEFLSSVEVYMEYEDESLQLPPVPEARAYPVAALLDNVLVVGGGYDHNEGFPSGDCWMLSRSPDSQWMAIPPMPVPVARAASVVVGEEGDREWWVLGGNDTEGNPVDTIQVYSISNGWHEPDSAAPLPEPMSNHCAVVHDNKMYIVHGVKCFLYSVRERKPLDTEMPSTNEEYEGASAAVARLSLDTEVMVVVHNDSVEYLNLPFTAGVAGDGDTWRSLDNLPKDKGLRPSVGMLGSRLYVMGGADNEMEAQDSVVYWERVNQGWRKATKRLEVKRQEHATVVMDENW